MHDDERVEAFMNGTLPPSEMSHPLHVRLVWADLQRHRLGLVIDRQVEGLRRFTERHGAQGKFHTTITLAFVLLIHERLETHGRHLSWDEFAARNPDLLSYRPSPLAPYYNEETLRSDKARRVFVLPDRGLGALGDG